MTLRSGRRQHQGCQSSSAQALAGGGPAAGKQVVRFRERPAGRPGPAADARPPAQEPAFPGARPGRGRTAGGVGGGGLAHAPGTAIPRAEGGWGFTSVCKDARAQTFQKAGGTLALRFPAWPRAWSGWACTAGGHLPAPPPGYFSGVAVRPPTQIRTRWQKVMEA